MNSNDYTLTLVVPPEVDHDFSTTVVLTHPYTKIERVIEVSFTYTQPKKEQVKKTPQAAVKQQQEPDYEEMPKQRKSDQKGSGGFGTYLAMFLVIVCTVAFIAQHWLGVNLTVSIHY